AVATNCAMRLANLRARARSATAVPLYSSSGPSHRRRVDNSSVSGLLATNRSQPSNTPVTRSTSGPTIAIAIIARRCNCWYPVSETETSNRLRNSAINGRTTDRFCFSERTSPSSRSNSSAPTYTDITQNATSGEWAGGADGTHRTPAVTYTRGFSRYSYVSMT